MRGLSQTSKVFLKLAKILCPNVFKRSTLNPTNLINPHRYNQPISDFVVLKQFLHVYKSTFCEQSTIVIVFSVLLLLDLSAVFDILDRDILLKSLHLFFSTNNDLKITIKFAVESECNTFSSLFSVIQHFCPISRLCFPGSLLVLAFACSLVSFVYVSFH